MCGRKNGFSLAEALISMLVVSVLMAAMLPVMTQKRTITGGAGSGWDSSNLNYLKYCTTGNCMAEVGGIFLAKGNGGPTSLSGLGGDASGEGTRMLWYPYKAAFRAGSTTGTHWDDGNIGNYSAAFGQDNTASGEYSAAMGGNSNNASGNDAVIAGGSNNAASSINSFIGGGTSNQAITASNSAVVGGSSNIASGSGAVVIGGGTNTASSTNSFIGGGTLNQANTSNNTVIIGGSNNNAKAANSAIIAGTNIQIQQNSDNTVALGYSASTYSINGDPNKFYLVGLTPTSTNGSTTFQPPSDRRLKNILGNYNKGLNEIVKLKPVKFNYKYDKAKKEHIGLIAQEVQPYFPESVTKNAKGYLFLNVDPIHFAYINAVKELKAENDRLKNENNKIKSENKQIKSQLTSIEERLDKLEKSKK